MLPYCIVSAPNSVSERKYGRGMLYYDTYIKFKSCSNYETIFNHVTVMLFAVIQVAFLFSFVSE